jgi:DnaK suppressor protein
VKATATRKSNPKVAVVKKPLAGKSVASKPAKSTGKTAGRAKPGPVKSAHKAEPAKPENRNGSASSTARLFKGKVASATAMVTPRTASASKPHDSLHKNQKNLSSSMNKLAAKKLDNGVTREDGRYALPATSTITLPKGYHPSSKEEYMNPQHLAYFRNKLRDWRDQLVEESRQTMDNLRDEVRDVGDEAERATRETENSLELRTRDRYRKLISKIDKALRRIEEGSYGFCEETDEEIGIDRLDARPIATLSLDAQERREHLQKQMGD